MVDVVQRITIPTFLFLCSSHTDFSVVHILGVIMNAWKSADDVAAAEVGRLPAGHDRQCALQRAERDQRALPPFFIARI